MLEVVADTCAQKFGNGLLLCPQAEESTVFVDGKGDALCFLAGHAVADEAVTYLATDAFDVDAHGPVRYGTADGLPTMGKGEVGDEGRRMKVEG